MKNVDGNLCFQSYSMPAYHAPAVSLIHIWIQKLASSRVGPSNEIYFLTRPSTSQMLTNPSSWLNSGSFSPSTCSPELSKSHFSVNHDGSTGRTSSKRYEHYCYPSVRSVSFAGRLARYSSGPFWWLLGSLTRSYRFDLRKHLFDSWLALIWHLLFWLVRWTQGQKRSTPYLPFNHSWPYCPDPTLLASLECSGPCDVCSYCNSFFPFFFTLLWIHFRTFQEDCRWWGQLFQGCYLL